MKKSLLLLGACLIGASSMFAETAYYPFDEMGDVVAVSGNGRWAVASDTEMNCAYLWDSTNPTVYTPITSETYSKVNAFDVSDDCLIVGQVYVGDSKWRPAIRQGLEGEWEVLSVDPQTLNTAEATCVSDDGKYIAGYMMIKGDEEMSGPIKGAYYPTQWTRNDDGDYEFKAFYDFDILGQQGFITYCQSNDGRIIGGMIHAGCSDAALPALILDGKFVMFDEVVYKMEPWYYKDKIMGEDEVSYINGFKDTDPNNTLVGMFQGVDDFGNLYGARTLVYDVNEDGEGRLEHYGAMYNVDSKEWYYTSSVDAYSIGYDRKIAFANNARIQVNGQLSNIKATLEFDAPQTLTAIMSMSKDTRTLAGNYQVFNEAIGGFQYYPFMLVLDEPLTDISSVEMIGKEKPVAIIVSAGQINFAGGEGIVYDLNGMLIGSGECVTVAPGTYVVKAVNDSRTVIVK